MPEFSYFIFYNIKTFSNGVMFGFLSVFSYDVFLFVSIDTVCVFNYFFGENVIRCTEIFVMCNIIVPLRPK